jgi:hypothetical protein
VPHGEIEGWQKKGDRQNLTKGLASPLKSSASLTGAQLQSQQTNSNYVQPIALLHEAYRRADGISAYYGDHGTKSGQAQAP